VKQVVIDNPVLNSPYSEPTRHFRFDDEGITNETVAERRVSSYFIPVAKPKKRGKQLVLETEWTEERIKENEDINRIRERVSLWRKGRYQGVTNTTRRLLEYWQGEDRDPTKRLFFCQIEALETIIYVKGVDVYDPTTGEIRSHTTDQIACWFIDTNYDGDSFFVRHAYFIFEHKLWAWPTDETSWPADRSFQALKLFFNVRFSSPILDRSR